MLNRNKRRLELAVILIAAAIGLGYTNLTTIGVSGNNFAAQLNNDFNGSSPISPLLDAGTVIQGNIAGKAGVSTDQIGGTQALAQINKVVCVDGFGAVGDGVTDDATAIQAAINACGDGCRVRFNCTGGVTTSKTYKIAHNASTGHGDSMGVQEWHSNTIIDLNGATIDDSLALFGIGDDSNACAGCFEATRGSGPSYAVTGATFGSVLLTMVNAGDETHFTAGQKFYIEGEHTDYLDEGGGYITFVDTTNHQLGLRQPLGKTYTPTPVVSPITYPYPHNITVENGNIINTNPPTANGIGLFFTDVFNIENITLDSNDEGTIELGFAPWNGTLINNHFTSRCNAALDISSRGMMNVQVIGGVYTTRRNANGTACGSQQINVTATGEGIEGVSYIGGTYVNLAGGTAGDGGITIFGSYNTLVQGVTVDEPYASNSAFSEGIGAYSGSNGTSPRVIGNTVVMNGGVGIKAAGLDGFEVSGNDISILGGSSTGLCGRLDLTPSTFTNNICRMSGQSTAISITNTGAGSTVTGNVIYNSASSGAVSPVTVDAASNPSGDSVIVGNTNVNAANYSAANFVNIGSGHANIIASRNSPSTQDTHP